MTYPAIRIINTGTEITGSIDSLSLTLAQPGDGNNASISLTGTIQTLANTITSTFEAEAIIVPPVPTDTPVGSLIADPAIVIPAGSFVSLNVPDIPDFAPRIERIARKVHEVASTVVSSVETPQNRIRVVRPGRLHWLNFGPQHLEILLVQEAESYNEERPHRTADRVQDFSFYIFAVPPDDSEQPTDQILNQVRADLIGKIMEDPQIDGLAIDTEFPDARMLPMDEGAYAGMELNMRVHYRTDLKNEYSGG